MTPDESAPAAVTDPARSAGSLSTRWSLAQRIAFRIVFVFALLELRPTDTLYGYVSDPINALVAAHLLHVAIPPYVMNGSSDHVEAWIALFTEILLAVLVASAWTALDRRPTRHATLDNWLRVMIRINLGLTLCRYGTWKLFAIGGQFPPPTLHRLLTPVGALSPASLMWTFMGSSPAYKFFTGCAELAAGLLVFRRRTATLGAALAAGVMANVVMMNFAYDVGVKIFSTELLLMALFLLLPDMRRLADVFILNRPTTPWEPAPLFARPLLNTIATIATTLVIAFMLGQEFWRTARLREDFFGAPVPLTGIYEVEQQVEGGVTVPPLMSDERRWRRLAIEPSGVVTVAFASDSVRSFLSATDTGAEALTIVSPAAEVEPRFDWRYQSANNVRSAARDTATAAKSLRLTLHYERPDAGHLVLSGSRGGTELKVHLRRIPDSAPVLTNWPLHFVHEQPFSTTWIEAPYTGAPGEPRRTNGQPLPLP